MEDSAAPPLIGLAVAGSSISYAILSHTGDEEFQFVDAADLKMQTGSRPNAYSVIYELLVDLIGGRKISRAYVIGTSVGGRAAQKAHFDAAELRGVVQAACASVCPVDIVNKASVSNHFGKRKFDEYVSDDDVWKKYGLQDLPKGRRAAAFAVIAQVLRKS